MLHCPSRRANPPSDFDTRTSSPFLGDQRGHNETASEPGQRAYACVARRGYFSEATADGDGRAFPRPGLRECIAHVCAVNGLSGLPWRADETLCEGRAWQRECFHRGISIQGLAQHVRRPASIDGCLVFLSGLAFPLGACQSPPPALGSFRQPRLPFRACVLILRREFGRFVHFISSFHRPRSADSPRHTCPLAVQAPSQHNKLPNSSLCLAAIWDPVCICLSCPYVAGSSAQLSAAATPFLP